MSTNNTSTDLDNVITPYSLDWWLENFEMAHMYSLAATNSVDRLRYRNLTDWIRLRITAKL